MRAPVLLSVALLGALAACAAVDPDPGWLTRGVAVEAAGVRAAAFEVPPALAIGFDGAVAGGRIAVGDRVLFGVRLDRDAEVEVRFVQAEVVAFENEEVEVPGELFDAKAGGIVTGQIRRVFVHAAVHDAEGNVLGDDTVLLDQGDLENGLAAACRGDAVAADPGSALHFSHEIQRAIRAQSAIEALRTVLSVVRRSQPLRALLWQVLDVPSLFSVIFHFGVKVSVAENFAGSARGAPFAVGAAAVPTWEAPLELRLNGAPALRCRVQVADPASPIALCAGIVSLRAASPSHPQRTVTMQLLGARRGSAR
jgi:hypothetical protein